MTTKAKTKSADHFGHATARLEMIIAQMDDPQTSLEDMIALVEEGSNLINKSRNILKKAELRIKMLDHPKKQVISSDEPIQESTNEFALT